jgi:hypothetical protein
MQQTLAIRSHWVQLLPVRLLCFGERGDFRGCKSFVSMGKMERFQCNPIVFMGLEQNGGRGEVEEPFQGCAGCHRAGRGLVSQDSLMPLYSSLG